MKKLINYSKLTPDLVNVLNLQFPNGLNRNSSTVKMGDRRMKTITFECDGIVYMVKLDTALKPIQLHEEDWPSTASKLINGTGDCNNDWPEKQIDLEDMDEEGLID